MKNLMHDTPCEALEATRLEVARIETAQKAQKRPNWAVWVPVFSAILTGLGAVVSGWIGDKLTKRASTVAEVVARKACLDLMVSQGSAYLNGVQAGKAEAQAEFEKRRLTEIPPLKVTK